MGGREGKKPLVGGVRLFSWNNMQLSVEFRVLCKTTISDFLGSCFAQNS